MMTTSEQFEVWVTSRRTMAIKFRDRISMNFLLATAILMALVYGMVYGVVRYKVYEHLDSDLEYEVRKHEKEIFFRDSNFVFINKKEWEEREHREVQVNPVFIQLLDTSKKTTDKSPNLKSDELLIPTDVRPYEHHSAILQDKPIRQVYIPLDKNDQTAGFMIAAIPLEDAQLVISSLKQILLLTYPLILLVLFFSTRILAEKSIDPVKAITERTNRISKERLNDRIPVQKTNDELQSLTISINNLLDRIEQAVNREKQFTSDASHELRTPLSVIKGKLEVLVRKPRSAEEYRARTSEIIAEIDRMASIVDQLLLLARFDNPHTSISQSNFALNEIIDDTIRHFRGAIEQSGLSVRIIDPDHVRINSDPALLRIMIDNLVSNAIKYSKAKGEIVIEVRSGKKTELSISNSGSMVSSNELENMFLPFFRGEAARKNGETRGQGLGLSITLKISKLLNIDIQPHIENEDQITFFLNFPSDNLKEGLSN